MALRAVRYDRSSTHGACRVPALRALANAALGVAYLDKRWGSPFPTLFVRARNPFLLVRSPFGVERSRARAVDGLSMPFGLRQLIEA